MILPHARTDRQTATESARTYLQRGWAPVPVPTGRKGPNLPGWQRTTYGAEDFSDTDNIGLKPGQPSNGLVDVDLDCDEAVALADEWLPPTGMEHGRPGKRRSHRWYLVADRLPKTTAYDDVDAAKTPQDGHKARLVELRSTGAQTLVPPSLHTSGDPYEWDARGTPATADTGTLETAVRQLAATALLARHWPAEGKRHDTALAVAGLLLRGGTDPDTAARMVRAAAEYAGDEEADSRATDVRTTADRLARGEPVTGGPRLAELLNSVVVAKLCEWLNLSAGTPATSKPQADTGYGSARTDLGNAERMIARHGERLKFVEEWGWVAWTGTHWDKHEGKARAWECATETVRSMYAEAATLADDEARRALLDHARQSEAVSRVKAMMEAASNSAAMRARPEEFDADPWLLNVRNGTLDLRTGALRAHDPADRLTQLARAPYTPDARSAELNRFLAAITCQDMELLRYLQKAIGMSLTGRTDADAVFLLYGPRGRNGKSSLLEAVMEALGTYAVVTPKETVLSKTQQGGIPNDVARLNGPRFVAISETAAEDKWDLAKLKQMSGGDRLTARFLGKEFFDFVPQYKLWVRTNHLPNVGGDDAAFWERVKVIPFNAYFGKDSGQQDAGLRDRLKHDGGNQTTLLAWAVEGCLRWQAEGLHEPPAVKEAVAQYMASQDPLQEFLEERTTRQEGARVAGVNDTFGAYSLWAQIAKETALPRPRFVEAMALRGYPKVRRPRGGGYVFADLVLRQQ